MCMMIVKPAGVDIPDEYIENSFDNNPDGAGFAYVKDGVIWLGKGYRTHEGFLRAYRKHVTLAMPALLHFRLATHGSQVEENCHPFSVAEGVVMAHNGIIPGMELKDDESDTRAFIRTVVQPDLTTSPSLLHQPAWHAKLEKMIGGSKLAFLAQDGKFQIVGEKLGTWNNGAWYSNGGYRINYSSFAHIYSRGGGSTWRSGGFSSESRDGYDTLAREVEYGNEPSDIGMEHPVLLNMRHIVRCTYCDHRIKGDFVMDLETGHVACSECVNVKSTQIGALG